MAARIVVEECLNVLLDLDDIDRLWVNASGPRVDKAELQKRRSNLLEVSYGPAAMPPLLHIRRLTVKQHYVQCRSSTYILSFASARSVMTASFEEVSRMRQPHTSGNSQVHMTQYYILTGLPNPYTTCRCWRKTSVCHACLRHRREARVTACSCA